MAATHARSRRPVSWTLWLVLTILVVSPEINALSTAVIQPEAPTTPSGDDHAAEASKDAYVPVSEAPQMGSDVSRTARVVAGLRAMINAVRPENIKGTTLALLKARRELGNNIRAYLKSNPVPKGAMDRTDDALRRRGAGARVVNLVEGNATDPESPLQYVELVAPFITLLALGLGFFHVNKKCDIPVEPVKPDEEVEEYKKAMEKYNKALEKYNKAMEKYRQCVKYRSWWLESDQNKPEPKEDTPESDQNKPEPKEDTPPEYTALRHEAERTALFMLYLMVGKFLLNAFQESITGPLASVGLNTTDSIMSVPNSGVGTSMMLQAMSMLLAPDACSSGSGDGSDGSRSKASLSLGSIMCAGAYDNRFSTDEKGESDSSTSSKKDSSNDSGKINSFSQSISGNSVSYKGKRVANFEAHGDKKPDRKTPASFLTYAIALLFVTLGILFEND